MVIFIKILDKKNIWRYDMGMIAETIIVEKTKGE